MIPTGIIILWWGLPIDVPNGWTHCNGRDGTPDLRDKFMRCVTPPQEPENFSNPEVHNHEYFGSEHSHECKAGSAIDSGSGRQSRTTDTETFGTVANASQLPPYKGYWYIIKVA